MTAELQLQDVEFVLPCVSYTGGASMSLDEAFADGNLNPSLNNALTVGAAILQLEALFSLIPFVKQKGQVRLITFRARGSTVYIRQKHRSDVSAAGTTNGATSNGFDVPSGTDRSFEISYPWTKLDVNCDANCNLYIGFMARIRGNKG